MPVFEKQIRDPIHGDIGLTSEEIQVIDTRQFQNLRGIKQLGLAYLVYPAATHTRFEHALGTLFMAQCIIDGINLNASRNPKKPAITEPNMSIIRLTALVHDISHAPFGHVVEDDLGLRKRHDSDERFARALNKDSEVGKILGEIGLLDQVRYILCAKDNRKIVELKEAPCKPPLLPYMADIISNTICADLLDYVRRDTYFTGIAAAFDDRIFDYFEVDPDSLRLAIRVEHKGRYRTAVMSEILNILRARYTLAERLFFHHANTAATAMLGRALLDWPGLSADDYEGLSDFEFLSLVESDGGDVARELIGRIRRRDFHKQVFVVSRAEAEAHAGVPEIEEDFRSDPEKRLRFEDRLEKEFRIRRGSLIIHCPPGEMTLKEAEVRVVWRGENAQVLKEIDYDPPKGEVKELNRKYESLWSLQAFLASDHLYLEHSMSELLETRLRLHNELAIRQKALWSQLGDLEKAYERVAKSDGLGQKRLKRLKMNTYRALRSQIQGAIRREETLSIDKLAKMIKKL